MSSSSFNPATLDYIQKETVRRRRQRKIATAIGAVLIAGLAVGGYFGLKAYNQWAQENRARQLAASVTTAGPSGFATMRKAVDSGEITREQAWAARREAMEKRIQLEAQGYFKTPEKDRDKYLDKLIDEMQKRMKEMEAARAANPTTRPAREGPPRDGATTRPDGERRDRGPGGMFGGGGDNTSPTDRAMRQEFGVAMSKRMQERGVQMPGRGGWGGGGRGGNGGGGGGGGNTGGGRGPG